MSNEQLIEKWDPVLNHKDLPSIDDAQRRGVVATILENTEKALRESDSSVPNGLLAETTNIAGNVDNYDPVLISLVRRSMPNLIAFDIAGVQPMTGPTGLIFALRSKYAVDPANTATWTEALYNEADTDFTGAGTHAGTVGTANTANTGTGMATATGEQRGISGGTQFAEMAFEIDKVSVTAKTRALKAEYTTELAQDLKSIHNLDAEQELANILTAEVLAEINRELVRTVYNTAKIGSQAGTAATGVFDLDIDANGRWSGEKFKGLLFHVDREANVIARETRRGKGNIIICSSDVATALSYSGQLDYGSAQNSGPLSIDDTGNTFAGVLSGRYRVYIDPYAGANYFVVGYKGSSAFDAGLFYCPYVPLQMVRAIGENTFQPKIGFKTRYGMVANPFSKGATASDGALEAASNVYYRKTTVSNIL